MQYMVAESFATDIRNEIEAMEEIAATAEQWLDSVLGIAGKTRF